MSILFFKYKNSSCLVSGKYYDLTKLVNVNSVKVSLTEVATVEPGFSNPLDYKLKDLSSEPGLLPDIDSVGLTKFSVSSYSPY